MTERRAEVERETGETAVHVEVDVDGQGEADVDTGVGFLDHMLAGFAKHGFFDVGVDAEGDVDETGDHHTVEDVAITLGMAFDEALGDRAGIRRFGDARAPMDEALASVVVDVSGRPHTEADVDLLRSRVADLSTEMVEHFFSSFAANAGLTLHVRASGDNDHHVVEAAFKAFALALDEATAFEGRREGVPSTKGEI
ncbi:MAG: imidazoleglycerol-phosphate dehydratase HisB [Halobacteriales archaeon]